MQSNPPKDAANPCPTRQFRRSQLLSAVVLALALILHADEEEIWSWDHAEFTLAPCAAIVGEGTLSTGQQKTIQVTPLLYTWPVYTSNLGGYFAETNNTTTSNPNDATVTFAIESGGGMISGATSDGDGVTTATYTMGLDDTIVRIDVSLNGTTASQWLSFTHQQDEEAWWYDHSESSLVATLSAPDGTQSLPQGTLCPINVHGEYQTWDIYISSYGSSELRNFTSSPAANATVNWTTSSGALFDSFTNLDGSGDSSTTLQIGSDEAIVSVTLWYQNSITTQASLELDPGSGEVWSYNHTEGCITASIVADGPIFDVAEGTQINATTFVTFQSWEVWDSNLGNTQYINSTTSPAIGATLSYSLIDSGGDPQPFFTATADENGQSVVCFTMGSGSASLRADISFSGLESTYATLETTPPAPGEWVTDGVEYISSVSLASAPINWNTASVTATVSQYAREFFHFTTTGETTFIDSETMPLSGAAVIWSRLTGDATLAQTAGQTDENGIASIEVGLGSSSSLIGSALGQAQGEAAAPPNEGQSVLLPPASPDPYVFEEVTGFLTLNPTMVQTSNDTARLTVTVIADTWDVYRNTLDNSTEIRNWQSGPCSCGLEWTVSGQEVALGTSNYFTNSSGKGGSNVFMGVQPGTVELHVNAGLLLRGNWLNLADSAHFDIPTRTYVPPPPPPDPWRFNRNDCTIWLSSFPVNSNGVTASLGITVNYSNIEIWKSLEDGAEESRNPSGGTASGASLSWTSSSDTYLIDAPNYTTPSGDGFATAHLGNSASTVEVAASFLGASASYSFDIPAIDPNLDTDHDGLPDWFEVELFTTNRLLIDSDGDGISDLQEVLLGTNPLAESTAVSSSATGLVVFSPLR